MMNAAALNKGREPREAREPQTKSIRSGEILFGADGNTISPAISWLESGSPASRGSHPIPSAADIVRAANSIGLTFQLRGSYIEWQADLEPTEAVLARLRVHKPELIEILCGDRCLHCSERLAWPNPNIPAVVFADSTAAHLACYEQAEVARIRAAAERAVDQSDMLTCPAQTPCDFERLLACGGTATAGAEHPDMKEPGG
jgi:hypothetical protein